jgi:hypothetical protein
MTITVLKGSRVFGMVKGRVYPVLDTKELGAEYSHQVQVRIQLTDRVIRLYARHKNRLQDEGGCNLNNGDPTMKVRVKFNGPTTPQGMPSLDEEP